MALTEVYIGSGGSDSNDGSSHANRKLTFNNGSNNGLFDEANMPASGGIRINVYSVVTLSESMDITSTFLNSNTISTGNQLLMQGYTAAANDGGIGEIDGAGSYGMFAVATWDLMKFRDLKMHNTGSAIVLDLDNQITLLNCEIATSTGGGINIDSDCHILGCYVHDITGAAINITQGWVYRTRIIDLSAAMTTGVWVGANLCSIIECVIWLNTASAVGINTASRGIFCCGNSIYQNAAGTGRGIGVSAGSDNSRVLINNLVEGFNGAGGVGIGSGSSGQEAAIFGNGVEDCTDEYEGDDDDTFLMVFDNESLSASPFTDGVNKDFSPVDTDGVKEGSQPDKIGLF